MCKPGLSQRLRFSSLIEERSDRFVLLVERYERPLPWVARSRLGRVDWAEEAVQETFLSAFKSAHAFDPPGLGRFVALNSPEFCFEARGDAVDIMEPVKLMAP